MDRGRSTKAGKSLLRKTTMKGEFAKKKFKRFILKKRKEKKRRNQGLGGEKRKVVSANGVV